MHLFFALITFVILTACSSQPQVTVTPFAEVTVTLPPPTLTATPTLAPTVTPTLEPMTYTPEAWQAMSPEQKLAAVPTIEGLKFNAFSTIEGMDQYAIYLDGNNDYAGSQNMLTGKFEKTGTGAIEVFRTENDGYYEMRAFGFEGMNEEQAKVAVEEMLYDVLVNDGVTYGLGIRNIINTRDMSDLNRLRTIKGLVDKAYFHIGLQVNEKGDLLDNAGFKLGLGTVFAYPSDESVNKEVYLRVVDPIILKNNLMSDYYLLPQGL